MNRKVVTILESPWSRSVAHLQNLILSFKSEIYKETYTKQICHRLKRNRKVRIVTNRGSSHDNFQVKTKKRLRFSRWSSRYEAMPHFFAAEKMLHTFSLKEATATCSLTRLKDSPKLFACSSSSRIVGFTATRHHQCPNNPPSVLLANQNKNALFTSYLSQIGKPLDTETQTSSLLPCIAEWDGPA